MTGGPNDGPGIRPLLRGYGPLACLLIAFALMAAFVPTDAPQRVTVAESSNSSNSVGGTTDPGTGTPSGTTQQGAGTPGAPTSTGGGGAGGTGSTTTSGGSSGGGGGDVSTQPVAKSKGCKGPQVNGDPYSPPCVKFAGNNGGVTARGVTNSTITIAYRQTSDPGFQQTLAEIGGAQFADTPADVERTINGLANYFNKNFQFYGRKLKFVFYNGQGTQTQELLGGGQQEADNDALHVADSIKAFADMSAATEPYGDALSRQKVLNFGEPYLSQKWFEQRAPYAWSLASDCSIVTEAASNVVDAQLYNKKAIYSPEFQGDTRKFATLAPDNPWYQECVQDGQQIDRQHHVPVPMNIQYQLDLSTLSNQASTVISKLRAAKVTTIVCGCDPVFPVYLTQKAAEQGYYPEWDIVGVALTDQDIVGQLFNQQEWKNAFGITYQGKTLPYQATLGYAAYKSVESDEPAQAVNLIYAQMYMLALGIQLAGPNLTAASFETGMRSYGGGTGEFGTWRFPTGDFTPTQDGAEIYWDPNAVSSYNQKQGAYILSSPRYLTGQIPNGNFPHAPYKGTK